MSDRITKLREDFDIELKAVRTDADAKALRDRWVGQGMATGKKGLILGVAGHGEVLLGAVLVESSPEFAPIE